MSSSRSRSWAHRLVAVVCLAMVDSGFAANHGITMGDAHAFSRPNITITAGDSVTWDSVTILTPHNVTCVNSPGACFSASGTILDTIFADSRFVLPNSTNPTYFRSAGRYDYRCTFHAEMTGIVNVNPGSLHHFNVVAPNMTAGLSFTVTVTARDQFNNVVAFNGTVQLSISSPHPAGGELPATATLSAGSGSFTVTPKSSGSRTVTVSSGSTTGSDTFTVSPAAASKFAISAPTSVSANGAFQVTVSARDAFDNLVLTYSGTVHFTSSDPAATLPANNTLASGSRNFNVTLRTAGPQTVTVTDTVNPAITGSVSVSVATACSISFNNPNAVNIPLSGNAAPYPSSIVVSGLKQTINGMTVTLNGLTHTQPADIDVLLVGPAGQKMIIMSDSGSTFDVSNISMTFSDGGTAVLPQTAILTSGTFKPTNQAGTDTFPSTPAGTVFSPAPTGTATFASVFNGADPNGTWSLFVVDDLATTGTSGSFAGGWTLSFGPPPNTFCNQASIALPVSGPSMPYPSTINISGINGTLRNISLRLDKLTETNMQDLDMLLVGPGGTPKMVIVSDAATGLVNNAVVTLDDAGALFPNPLASGVFRPRSFTPQVGFDSDLFPAPAPSGPYSQPDPQGTATFASVFGGGNPNGSWNLYVNDDFNVGTGGSIAGGWSLTLDVLFNTSITLDANINPSVVGQLVTLTANVSSSGPVPTGTVTFRVGGVETATVALEDGTATLFTNFVAGTYNFTATFNGDANFKPSTSATLVQTVNAGPTVTGVVSSANPTNFGQAVTFTATVSESSPFTPSGTVTFLDGDSVLGTRNLNAAVAALTTTGVGGGSRSITAVYSGDVNFAPSTSPVLTQTVLRAPTSTTLVASPNPSTLGSPVTFTATVSGGVLGVPSGTLTFKDGSTTIGTSTVNESGVGTFSISDLSVGAHNITAIYEGNEDFVPSTSGTVSQTVEKATPSISLISFLNPAEFGQEVTFRADVSSSLSTAPTGTVFFKDGQIILGTVTLDGSGTALFSTSTLTAGNHSITAGYDGDSNFKGNISPVVAQEVIGLESVTTLTANLNPAVFGPAITFRATVTAASGGPASGGTVTFFQNGEVMNAASPVNSLGVAQGGAQLPAGQYTITATYNGGPVFAASTSNSVTQTVNPSTARFLGPVSPSKFFFRFREPIGFQVQVISNTGGTPTGTVTLFEDDTALGMATLDAAGRATVLVNGLRPGEHRIRAVYGGDSNFPAGAESQVIVYSESPRPR